MPDFCSHLEAMLADLRSLDRYTPLIQIAVLADHRGKVSELPYLDRASEIDVPSLGMFSEGLLEKKMRAPETMKSKDVAVDVIEGFNHFDIVYGKQARERVFQACQEWIEAHTTETGPHFRPATPFPPPINSASGAIGQPEPL